MRRFKLIHVLLLLALTPGVEAGYDLLKAELAQVLISRAWVSGDDNSKPWPWADTVPVARLQIESLNLDTLVLGGGNGHAMAFGPGMSGASAGLGNSGVTLISAHRDTHFSALENVSVGVEIKAQGKDRRWHYYVVSEINIIDDSRQMLLADTPGPTLVLSTCYPFDVLVMNSTKRMLVSAQWVRAEA